jgi:D-alanine-D-alanine ligase
MTQSLISHEKDNNMSEKTMPIVGLLVDTTCAIKKKGGDLKLLYPHEKRILASLTRSGCRVRVLRVEEDLGSIQTSLEKAKPDVVFNLVEEFMGHRRFDALAAEIIECLGIPITGNDSLALRVSRDKSHTKAILMANGLAVPRGAVVRSVVDLSVDRLLGMTLPLIVKPLSLDGSDFVSTRSVCSSYHRAMLRAEWLLRVKGEMSIIEEFVEGRELGVAITAWPSCETWVIREMRRPTGCHRFAIASGAVKDRRRSVRPQPTFIRARLNAAERVNVEKECYKAFNALGLRSYARFDLILRDDGIPIFLEANPNCCLAPRAYGVEGGDKRRFDQLIMGIVSEALTRRFSK